MLKHYKDCKPWTGGNPVLYKWRCGTTVCIHCKRQLGICFPQLAPSLMDTAGWVASLVNARPLFERAQIWVKASKVSYLRIKQAYWALHLEPLNTSLSSTTPQSTKALLHITLHTTHYILTCVCLSAEYQASASLPLSALRPCTLKGKSRSHFKLIQLQKILHYTH